jgi:hypothetical protein
MEFFIEIEMTGGLQRKGGLLAEPVPEDNRKFLIKGVDPGTY